MSGRFFYRKEEDELFFQKEYNGYWRCFNMQSIAVVYFSGTGNTEYVAKNMIKIIKEHNIHVDLINIEKGIVSFKDYDAVIIGGPVYVERYPEILLKYIENAMKHYKGKCMLFTTQAVDKPTMAFQHAINRLDFLNITYCLFVPMPNNFYNFMFEKTSKEESEKRVEKSYDICKVAVDDFLNGKTQFFEFSKTTVNMINWVYNLYYSHFTKFITKRINIDKDKCINCRLCEKDVQ